MGKASVTRENLTDSKGADFTQGKIKQKTELLFACVSLSPRLKQCWWFMSYCV